MPIFWLFSSQAVCSWSTHLHNYHIIAWFGSVIIQLYEYELFYPPSESHQTKFHFSLDTVDRMEQRMVTRCDLYSITGRVSLKVGVSFVSFCNLIQAVVNCFAYFDTIGRTMNNALKSLGSLLLTNMHCIAYQLCDTLQNEFRQNLNDENVIKIDYHQSGACLKISST